MDMNNCDPVMPTMILSDPDPLPRSIIRCQLDPIVLELNHACTVNPAAGDRFAALNWAEAPVPPPPEKLMTGAL